MPADPVVVTRAVLDDWRLPAGHGDKQQRGQVLVVGGAVQTPGAVMLAAVAALRAGAGKLQIATVRSAAMPVATAIPEAYVEPLPETAGGGIDASAAETVARLAEHARAVLVGPGTTGRDATARLVVDTVALLPTDLVVVVDALALIALERAPECLLRFEGRAIATPNLKELALVAGVDEEAVHADVVAVARAVAERHGVVVCAGGAESVVVTPDGRCWVDSSGHDGLAVSGSGDTLAGVVTGLAARGAEPAQAAVWAAHVHGRAGDRLAASVGHRGFLAREVVEEVPRVLVELEA